MNRDDVITLAHRTCTKYAHLERVRYGFTEAEMMRFAELVAGHEREWVGLTKEEAADCWSTEAVKTWHAIEAALKAKNAST